MLFLSLTLHLMSKKSLTVVFTALQTKQERTLLLLICKAKGELLKWMRQSAKTADWLVDNDVVWPVLHNSACANPRKLKDRSKHGG